MEIETALPVQQLESEAPRQDQLVDPSQGIFNGSLMPPAGSCHEYIDVQRYLESRQGAVDLIESAAARTMVIDVRKTMQDLMTVAGVIKLALGASYGFKCHESVVKILDGLQNLTKLSAKELLVFVKSCVKAIGLHREAYNLVNMDTPDLPTALVLMKRVSQEAKKLVASSEKLVTESKALVTVGGNALMAATEDRTKSTEERERVKKQIQELEVSESKLTALRAQLRVQVEEAKKREDDAFNEEVAKRRRQFALGILGAVATGVAAVVSPAAAVGFAAAAAALTKSNDGGNSRAQSGKSDEPQAAEPVAAAPKTREVILTEARLELQKQELAAIADLAESVARLEHTRVSDSDLELAVAALDIAVKALGEVKTTFLNVQYFWESVHDDVELLCEAADEIGDVGSQKELLSRRIAGSGFDWTTLGYVNYAALTTMKAVDGEVDNTMRNLPTRDEAAQIVETEAKKVRAILDERRNKIKNM